MANTPFFPAWRPRLDPLGSRTAQAVAPGALPTPFANWKLALPPGCPPTSSPRPPNSQNSRDRDYTRWRTFWCMLWQGLNPGASGREVVRQLQALFALEDGPLISQDDGAYCRAKARLPLSEFPKGLAATAKAADQQAPPLSTRSGAGPSRSSMARPSLWPTRPKTGRPIRPSSVRQHPASP